MLEKIGVCQCPLAAHTLLPFNYNIAIREYIVLFLKERNDADLWTNSNLYPKAVTQRTLNI
jgi:hypothetical protein